MKRLLSESAAEKIFTTLLERFGDSIGDAPDVGPGISDETPVKGEDPGNYGWGSSLDEGMCFNCGGDMPPDEGVCDECGMMDEMESCGLNQKAPPGGEKVVKALKKQKGVKNPWAVAWSMKNRGEI